MVWGAIANSIEGLISTWWEYPEIVGKLHGFRRVSSKYAHIEAIDRFVFLQSLFVPLVEKLGYEYPAKEPRDTTLLRTLAVKQAADAEDEG